MAKHVVATVSEIKPGGYLGTANVTSPAGGKATEVHLMDNGPNVHFAMDADKGLMMTNGHVKSVQTTAKYIYSGDGNGKIYQLDKNTGKLLGWAQTSLGRGQAGCLIHSLHAEGDNVLYKGSCTQWDVEKITIK